MTTIISTNEKPHVFQILFTIVSRYSKNNIMIEIETLIQAGAAFKEYKAGEIVFKEGTNSNFYYQLVEGRVRWVNIDEEGKEFLQIIINEGESFGELPLFDDQPFAATAIADTDIVIIRLLKSSFHQIIKETPEIHFAFSKLLTQRLRFKFLILKEIANHNPQNSISTLLNYFKQNNKNICGTCNQLKLTRQQIADMIGLRVETVIRTMRNMHEKGELTIAKGKVYC